MNPHNYISRFQKSIYAQSIRRGLTLAIPFLIMGSFALLFLNFPSDTYQRYLEAWINGALTDILTTVYSISLGSLALVLIITISLSYGLLAETDTFMLYPLVAISSYLAFCGGIMDQPDYIFDAEWVFTAMCITLLSCILFQYSLRIGSRFERLHTTGAEYLFNISIQSLFPVIAVIVFFAVIGYLLRLWGGGNNIVNFGSYLFLRLFDGISGNIFGILLYVILTHALWFLGIHGTNTLEAVSRSLFEHNIDINQALVNSGKIPTEIFSKTFLDTFVFLGGCGCALSFVIALCLASKKSHNRKIAYVALPSALFNISEIAVFGFPIIFNFTMLVPFILAPVVLTLISTFATWTGLVPVVTQSVDWTVPIIVSGYKATGSVAGSLLQIFNIFVGVLIYMPFIRRGELKETSLFKEAIWQMERDMAAGEKNGHIPRFLNRESSTSHYAKTLAMDLHNAMRRGQIQLFYQPQITAQDTLHGAEALMRWKHPVAGYIAPPLAIALAYEDGFLNELSYYLLNRACKDAQLMDSYLKDDIHLSVNVSPKEMLDSEYFDRVTDILNQYELRHIHLILEITERAAMEMSDALDKGMERLKNLGIEFSLDDFGMGHNSILQLQENTYCEVKLDGSLVTQLPGNERSKDIISSILRMSNSLNCRTVAEFVETKEQRDMLLSLGCTIYQGYYYSRPIELGAFLDYLK